MIIKKEEIGKTLIIAWFIIATLYVGYDFWSDYKIRGIDVAYQAGITDTINKLLEQSEKSQCQPFEVYSGDKKTKFLDANCLAQTNESAEKQNEQPQK